MENATKHDKLEFVKDIICDMLNDTYNATGHMAGDIAYNILDKYHMIWNHLKTLQRLTRLDSGVGFRLEPNITALAKTIVKDMKINMENITWYRADEDTHSAEWYVAHGNIGAPYSMAKRIARVGTCA